VKRKDQQAGATSRSVLIVDDEEDILELIELTLLRMGLDVDRATTVKGAIEKVQAGDYDLCLTDMRLPDGDGLDLIAWIQENRPDLPVAVITAHGNVESAVRALKLGAFDFVSKPLDLGVLRKLVGSAIRLGDRSDIDSATANIRGPSLIGSSAAMEQLREMIARVARSQAPVHIFGESGTGKELVARLVHASGSRRDGPFIAVNCGAIPTELMESELFGHVKGAFTDARADRVGRFELADGSTLFLDEIANVPLNLQAKLLRVLETGDLERVGSSTTRRVNVRVLAATNADVNAEAAAGRFRQDLLFRLNTIEIHIPPLRDRREDVDLLAHHFVHGYAQRYRKNISGFDPAAMKALHEHAWPGNVRELDHAVERGVLLSPGPAVRAADLGLRAQAAGGAAKLEEMSLDEVERYLIQRTLSRHEGNVSQAAKALGLSRSAMYRRLQKHGLE